MIKVDEKAIAFKKCFEKCKEIREKYVKLVEEGTMTYENALMKKANEQMSLMKETKEKYPEVKVEQFTNKESQFFIKKLNDFRTFFNIPSMEQEFEDTVVTHSDIFGESREIPKHIFNEKYKSYYDFEQFIVNDKDMRNFIKNEALNND